MSTSVDPDWTRPRRTSPEPSRASMVERELEFPFVGLVSRGRSSVVDLVPSWLQG